MWVPVAVEDDHGISSLQVEAQSSSTCAQQEDEVVRVGLIEHLQQIASLIRLGRP